jgi:hypothetical protein
MQEMGLTQGCLEYVVLIAYTVYPLFMSIYDSESAHMVKDHQRPNSQENDAFIIN